MPTKQSSNVTSLHQPKLYGIDVSVTIQYTLYEQACTEAEVSRIVGQCIADGSITQYAAHSGPREYKIDDVYVITDKSDMETPYE